jgi:hypothetical protein
MAGTHHRRFGDSGRVPGSIARLNNGMAVASVSAIRQRRCAVDGRANPGRPQQALINGVENDRSSMRRGSFEGAPGCGHPATPRQ